MLLPHDDVDQRRDDGVIITIASSNLTFAWGADTTVALVEHASEQQQ